MYVVAIECCFLSLLKHVNIKMKKKKWHSPSNTSERSYSIHSLVSGCFEFFFFCSFPSNFYPYYIEWRERSGTVRNTLTYSRQELNTLFIFVVKLTRLLFGMWQDASQTKLKNNQEQSTLQMAAVVCEKPRLMDIFILFFIRAPWFRSNAANNKAKKTNTSHVPHTKNNQPKHSIESNRLKRHMQSIVIHLLSNKRFSVLLLHDSIDWNLARLATALSFLYSCDQNSLNKYKIKKKTHSTHIVREEMRSAAHWVAHKIAHKIVSLRSLRQHHYLDHFIYETSLLSFATQLVRGTPKLCVQIPMATMFP